jgi:phosphoglycerate dehydrogenase-like enzyme
MGALMKAVLQYRAHPEFIRQVRALESDWLSVSIVDETDGPTFVREMADADVLLHVLERVTPATIDRAPQLKLIQKVGIGVDTIDLVAAQRRNIAVCNMPGTNTRAVAELTMLLILATLRRLPYLHEHTRSGGGWQLSTDTLDSLHELGGKLVGLVGFGAVGRCLAPMLRAMGADVAYTDLQPVVDAPGTFMPFAELLAAADIVSLHLPLTAETAGMMNGTAFSRMKPGSILINAARGGLVDEAALLSALQSRRLGAAGLDVFAAEPVDSENPLLHLTNVVVTPHLAWLTAETLSRSLRIFLENCRRLRDGDELVNRVI